MLTFIMLAAAFTVGIMASMVLTTVIIMWLSTNTNFMKWIHKTMMTYMENVFQTLEDVEKGA